MKLLKEDATAFIRETVKVFGKRNNLEKSRLLLRANKEMRKEIELRNKIKDPQEKDDPQVLSNRFKLPSSDKEDNTMDTTLMPPLRASSIPRRKKSPEAVPSLPKIASERGRWGAWTQRLWSARRA